MSGIHQNILPVRLLRISITYFRNSVKSNQIIGKKYKEKFTIRKSNLLGNRRKTAKILLL